jgi:hypothetical protein
MDMSIALIENPDEIMCTLQFKMRLKEWKQIDETLSTNSAFVELKIINEIRDLVSQLEKTLHASESE